MTAVYVQNISPHNILRNITLEESFTGVKPKVVHFRIFGCPVYIHVPKEKRSKLEPSSRKGTCVGYSESSKAYWIYISGQRKIEVSRDVSFEEEAAFRKLRRSHIETDSEREEEMVEKGLPRIVIPCRRQRDMQFLVVISEKVRDPIDSRVI
jgi:hypothetical protein